MFEKLLSLVPYNPGLVPQLAFYSRRMREEASIRRTGTIFLVIAFFIQFFAVLSPPQSSVAGTPNDIINGGVSSIADARAKCVADTQGFQRILHYYGISCTRFDSARIFTLDKGKPDYNSMYSMGRKTSAGHDTPVNIPGEGNKVYWRSINTWQTKSWRTIHVMNQDGKNFYIIMDCGNPVTAGIPSPSPLKEKVSGPITSTTYTPAPTPAPKPTPAAPTPAPPAPTPPTPTPTPPTPEVPCEKTISSSNLDACIQVSKSAANVTSGLADANNSTANAGDVITYTLYGKNTGEKTVKDYIFEENMLDVLAYADVSDLHGGTMDTGSVVRWPAIDIKADESRSVQITVRVKDPIPQTPSAPSDTLHYDLMMTNVYGNAINIKLPGSPAKQVEVAAAALPNTGPGETLAVAAVIVILAGYFYSRASLLARESKIAVKEAASV